MSTNQTLRNMLLDIQRHERDQAGLLEHYIQLRLDRSLINYYTDLMQTYDFLSHRDAQRVLKQLVGGN